MPRPFLDRPRHAGDRRSAPRRRSTPAPHGVKAVVLFSVVGTCKHLGLDPFAYLREALPGLFALGEEPTTEQLLD